MGDPNFHNKDLFRWKRQTEPLVHHSGARKNKPAHRDGDGDQVEKWLRRVEAATDVAARRTFSTEEPVEDVTNLSNLHRHFNNNVRFHEQTSEVAHAEAQDLLNDWMTKNYIDDLIGDEVDEGEPFRTASPESPVFLESDVTKAVRSNVDLHHLYENIEAVNENDVVQDIMSNLLVAPIEENAVKLKSSKKPTPISGWLDNVITEKAKKSLGLPVTAPTTSSTAKNARSAISKNVMVKILEEEENREAKIDHRKRIGDRHEQVRQNRLIRERRIEEEREKRRRAKEIRRQAEEMVTKEEKEATMRRLAEEEEIKREMARIKREMDEQKAHEEEEKRRFMEEEMRKMAEEEEEMERKKRANEEAKWEEAARERERQLKLQKLDIRIRNAQQRTLRVHFSAWRNVIIDQRLQMGQARAIADWRLLMKTWATWNGKYKTLWATHEGQRHLETMREEQRRQKAADAFYRNQLLSKCLRSWNIWVRAQLLEKELEKEKVETQRKMQAFLKACAINDERDIEDVSERVDIGSELSVGPKEKKPPQGPKKLQPWQVTKKHVYEGIDSKASDGDKTSSENVPAPSTKTKSAYIVDTFQHRHQAQEKMLKTQQEIIKEQQRMLEDMKYLATQNSLQQQLKTIQNGDATEVAPKPPPKSSRMAAVFDGVEKSSPDDRPASASKLKISAPKPNKFVQDMEARSRQRAERKAELDRLKELRQKEKIEAQRRKEEEERRKEEEEKQKRLEEAREKKRLEKEQELEKQRKLEETKQKLEMAEDHDRRRLLKWYGVNIWKKCLESGRRKNTLAVAFRDRCAIKSHLRAWVAYVGELNVERDRKSGVCRTRQLRRKCFLAWRGVKEESLLLEVKARQFWASSLTKKVFGSWGNWAHNEKMMGWEKERTAQRHFEETLVKRVFQSGFKQLPVLAKKERERELRKNELRRKVADLLPDFSGN